MLAFQLKCSLNKMRELENPKVAIFMITYNHEKFIEQAIESALMQKTTFTFKIFIGEDCSTDHTREICQKLKTANTERIELCLNDHNLGSIENAKQVYNSCFASGAKYVALLEGDDYWTDPYKLEKQVNILDSNEDFIISFCNVLVKNEDNDSKNYPAYQNNKYSPNYTVSTFPSPKEKSDAFDIAKGNFIHNPSVVFRNIFNKRSLPKYFSMVPIGDWPLYMYLTQFGSIHYSDEIMAVYRVHNESLFSSLSQLQRECMGLKQYPPMISEGIFEKRIIALWENHIIKKLAEILKAGIGILNEQEITELFNIFNSTKPSLLKKSIELIILELTESQYNINSIQVSRTYRLSCILQSIPRFIRNLFSTNKTFRSYIV